jgi:hypothetical protein
MALVHLIYVSSARTGLSANELTRWLEFCARHNAAQSLTAMLS